MSSNKVVLNNTVLRDGHQSLAATRMKTDHMLPALKDLDSLGFGILETWGGATIDSCLRFLGENPFERITKLKKGAPNTPHSMLLRGQNIVQYKSFPDDVVEAFVKCTADRGMDELRIFDALNDPRNLRTAIQATLKAGKTARGEICYTSSPVHNIEAFVKFGQELVEMGCQSISIKDMAGLIAPGVAFQLVSELKKKLDVPIILHSHDTAGLAATSYCAAVEAGVDRIETSIVPFANGSAQPDTARMLVLLEGSPRCPDCDRDVLDRLAEHFKGVAEDLKKFIKPASERVDSNILRYQIPGGMLSNFLNQLEEQKMADKLPEVMKEIAYVRQCLGYIPLVTPTSQIVGTQAMMNVKFGRWKMLSEPAQDVALGKYGKTPGPIDPEVQKAAIKQSGQQPVDCRPADLLQPGMDALRKEIKEKGLPVDDETAVLYAMFPQEVMKLAKGEKPAEPKAAPPSPSKPAAPAATSASPALTAGSPCRMALTVNGREYDVAVEEV